MRDAIDEAISAGTLEETPQSRSAQDLARWDVAARNMVHAYGSWQAAYTVCDSRRREHTTGYNHYHWNKMKAAFMRIKPNE